MEKQVETTTNISKQICHTDELKLHVNEVENIITKYCPEESGFQKTIFEAMNYSFLAGGKRIRPLLMLETYRLFGGTGDIIEPFMAAIEMIHTYSLIHDDLPALDNDDLRRGRKTSHKVFGEAMAILAGDALLNYAFETACRAFTMDPENKNTGRAFTILATKAGVNGMIGGQVVDVEMTGHVMTSGQLEFVYENKTGALIEAAMMIGAVLAGASDEEVSLIEKTASDIGLAFQIQDDLLDLTGDSEVLGKPVLSDEENGKVTYVTINGIEESKNKVLKLSERAASNITGISGENQFLHDFILKLINREK